MVVAPRTVGNYRLYEKIGAGGMGSVHLGRYFASGGFRRIVAIKRLHPQYAEDAEFVSAFLDEARLASRVHHPNVVAPLDVVSTDGEVFLVFEHLLGVSLATLLRITFARDESVPLPIAVSMMVDVLHGLHAAHEANGDDGESLGLVHRDVSPQNILVGKDGSSRLLDFGIAKAAGRSQTTGEGIVKGKQGYMAPEHLLGQTCRASDLYSAAVVLWEIVARRRLFTDEVTIADRLAGRVVESPFAHASAATCSNPAAVESILHRGLAHEPERRFVTAREMAIALEALGVATSREVGEWVERVGHAELVERARLVSSVESSILDGPVLERSSSAVSPRPADSDAQYVSATFMTVADTPSSRTKRRTRRRAIGALIAMTVIACIGLLVLVLGRRTTTSAVATPTSATITPAATAPAHDVATVVPATAAPTPSATPDAVEAKVGSAAVTPPTSTRPRASAKRPVSRCAPYVIDSHGRKKFNEACLR